MGGGAGAEPGPAAGPAGGAAACENAPGRVAGLGLARAALAIRDGSRQPMAPLFTTLRACRACRAPGCSRPGILVLINECDWELRWGALSCAVRALSSGARRGALLPAVGSRSRSDLRPRLLRRPSGALPHISYSDPKAHSATRRCPHTDPRCRRPTAAACWTQSCSRATPSCSYPRCTAAEGAAGRRTAAGAAARHCTAAEGAAPHTAHGG
jgi:hypothetical protein